MNEEIVRILEREFPEPWVAGARVEELLEMLSVLQKSGATRENIEKLAIELKATIEGIYSGRVVGLDQETRDSINAAYQEWQLREFENQQDDASMDYDAIEAEGMAMTGSTAKFIGPDGVHDPAEEKRKRVVQRRQPTDDDPFEDKK